MSTSASIHGVQKIFSQSYCSFVVKIIYLEDGRIDATLVRAHVGASRLGVFYGEQDQEIENSLRQIILLQADNRNLQIELDGQVAGYIHLQEQSCLQEMV